MDKEKFKAVLEYFEEIDIEVPVSVKNAIEDVFLENDLVEKVDCYHKEDKDQFQKDLKLINKIDMYIGRSTLRPY